MAQDGPSDRGLGCGLRTMAFTDRATCQRAFLSENVLGGNPRANSSLQPTKNNQNGRAGAGISMRNHRYIHAR